MVRLPDDIITTVLNLQGRLLEGINEAKAAEATIFELYAETDATAIVLEQLQNAAERLRVPYLGLFQLLLRIAEVQPIASPAMLNSLAQTIERAEVAVDASAASVQEAKRDWNIL